MAANSVLFPNLKAEMARQGLSGKKVAKGIGVSDKTFSNKMLGISEFTRDEMFKLRDMFFKGKTMEYLFERSEERPKSKSHKTA